MDEILALHASLYGVTFTARLGEGKTAKYTKQIGGRLSNS